MTRVFTNGQRGLIVNMIKYSDFSYFDAFDDGDIQTIVNTINCVGVMGKGLALEFKIRYPDMYADYVSKWESKKLKVGKPYVFKTATKWILNFPTKNHWRFPSKIEFIEDGLNDFAKSYAVYGIKSIAFPKLGCSFGGLQWADVKKVMEKYLNPLKNIEVYVFLDKEASEKEKKILDVLNDENKEILKTNYGFSEKQSEALLTHINKHGTLTRVRDLLRVKGVGIKTYQRIVEKRKNLNSPEQLSFGF